MVQGQLREYDRLHAGRVKQSTLRSVNDLPKAIIEARIATRVTQKGLAGRLGVVEQQVQLWEATDWAGVSVERLQQLSDARGARITEKIQLGATGDAAVPHRGLPYPKRRAKGLDDS